MISYSYSRYKSDFIGEYTTPESAALAAFEEGKHLRPLAGKRQNGIPMRSIHRMDELSRR